MRINTQVQFPAVAHASCCLGHRETGVVQRASVAVAQRVDRGIRDPAVRRRPHCGPQALGSP